MPVPPPGAIRGYHPRFAPYPGNQGPPALSPEKLDLQDRVVKQIEYYFRQVYASTAIYFVLLILSCASRNVLEYFPCLDRMAVLTFRILIPFLSDENLQNDQYLISLMDEQGWVPIKIIADFKRVKLVTQACLALLLCFCHLCFTQMCCF